MPAQLSSRHRLKLVRNQNILIVYEIGFAAATVYQSWFSAQTSCCMPPCPPPPCFSPRGGRASGGSGGLNAVCGEPNSRK